MIGQGATTLPGSGAPDQVLPVRVVLVPDVPSDGGGGPMPNIGIAARVEPADRVLLEEAPLNPATPEPP